MKCIKEKCKYCKTHDFYNSYYSCHIGGSFKKDNEDINCVISDKIVDIELELEKMKKYRGFIDENQI